VAIVRRLVFTAACTGLLTGLLATVMHQVGTVPLILLAKVYERATDAKHDTGHAAQPPGAAHNHAAHDHEDQGWEPRDGLERIAHTVLADILATIGYGLLLAVAFALRSKEVTWRARL